MRVELQITNLVNSSQTEYDNFTASSTFNLPSSITGGGGGGYVQELEKQVGGVVQQMKVRMCV